MLQVATLQQISEWNNSGQFYSFFGAGYIADKTLAKLASPPQVIFDNNRDINTRSQDGIPISLPSADSLCGQKILITSTSIVEIHSQLIDLGVPDESIFVTPVLSDHYQISLFESLNFDFLFTSGLQNRSQSKDLVGGGLYRLTGKFDNYTIQNILEGPSHGIKQKDGLLYVVNEIHGVAVLDSSMNLVGSYELPLGLRPHGIDYCSETEEWILACSYGDCILVLDVNFKLKHTISFSGKMASFSGKPQHHTNDVCVHGNYAYCSMFSLNGEFKRGHYDGGLLVIDLIDRTICGSLFGDLSHPHNVRSFDGEIWVLDSFNRRIMKGSHCIAEGFPSFLRGLDFLNSNLLLLGQSKNRNFSTIKSFASNPTFLDTSVVVLSLDPFIAKSLSIPSSISEIHAIHSLI